MNLPFFIHTNNVHIIYYIDILYLLEQDKRLNESSSEKNKNIEHQITSSTSKNTGSDFRQHCDKVDDQSYLKCTHCLAKFKNCSNTNNMRNHLIKASVTLQS